MAKHQQNEHDSVQKIHRETPLNEGGKQPELFTNVITPVSDHFVRNHYEVPVEDADSWSISLIDRRGNEASISMERLRKSYLTESVVHTMECSGNGRRDFEPDGEGVQWDTGGVSTARWTGTPVSALLKEMGTDPDDESYINVTGGDAPEGADVFVRSIPVAKMQRDCILAYRMNGRDLPPEHGHPVRLIVPGWYGNNAVKWVQELRVTDEMIQEETGDRDGKLKKARWQQSSYRLYGRNDSPISRGEISEYDTRSQMKSEQILHPFLYDQLVMSAIGFPVSGSTFDHSEMKYIEVRGMAWAGDDRIQAVEVSLNGGETWEKAELIDQEYEFAWRPFRYTFPAEAGTYTLVSRATDEHGRTQPERISKDPEGPMNIQNDRFPWNVKGYGNNAYRTYGVDITIS